MMGDNMNNIEKNGFLDLPLCDDHFHLMKFHPVDVSVRVFGEIIDYFSMERITLNALTQCMDSENDPASNVKALYIKAKLNETHPDRALVFGNIYHFLDGRDSADSYLRQVKQLDAMGVDGYKTLDGKPLQRKLLGRELDDPIYDKMYAYIEERGMPVKMHLGDPPVHWDREKISPYAISRGWFCDETFPTLEKMRDEVDGILTKFPKLRLCLAHFYFLGHDLEAAVDFFEKWENVSFDLTPGAEMFVGMSERHDEWRAFFHKYADRLYFGSDTYNKPEDCYEESGDAGHRINLVRKMLEYSEPFEDMHIGTAIPLALERGDIMKICHDNMAARNPHARPLDAGLIAQHAADLLEALEHGFLGVKPAEHLALEIENLRTVYEYFAK